MYLDNIVTDTEWAEFFNNFIEPFQKCDPDKNYLLNTKEFKACLNPGNSLIKEEGEIDHFSYINFVLKEDDKIELMEHLLDQNKINLFSYIYMRRLNYAWKVCSTSGSLAAVSFLYLFNGRTKSNVPSPTRTPEV